MTSTCSFRTVSRTVSGRSVTVCATTDLFGDVGGLDDFRLLAAGCTSTVRSSNAPAPKQTSVLDWPATLDLHRLVAKSDLPLHRSFDHVAAKLPCCMIDATLARPPTCSSASGMISSRSLVSPDGIPVQSLRDAYPSCRVPAWCRHAHRPSASNSITRWLSRAPLSPQAPCCRFQRAVHSTA